MLNNVRQINKIVTAAKKFFDVRCSMFNYFTTFAAAY